ncbi:GvpL/GvpF family gas vesicle protein [Streptomyces sp. NPDC101393]|uniref:GvpL/GvpF family gas vesicle protein n=1 Tax=Streptomyces sp. NPDC101393 TaxID=3366141 RepID=UPI0037FAB686
MNTDVQAAAAGSAPQDRPTAQPESGPRISYVYAISRAATALDAAAPGLTGLGGGPLRTVTAGGLAALVSSVPADTYSAEGMKSQLEDLAGLEAIARTHHALVEAAYTSTTVLPMRLATVYLDDCRVTAMLQERAAGFAELLDWLEGHVELGVKVYSDPREAAAAEPPAPAPGAEPDSPGRAYLQKRRAQRRTHRDAYRAAGAVAAGVPERASALARARVVHRPQQGELASGAGENIANEAYLVPADRVREFRQALAGLGDDVPGVRVEITGPWAPYSFATPTEAGGRT